MDSHASTPLHILLIRFRQMGDMVVLTPVLDTLRRTFPDAQIDVVLNERLAPLLDGHPSGARVITFSEDERHHLPTYLSKVWHTVHATRYDIIIDFRSTANTLLFPLFSLRTKWRIGLQKSYSRLVLTHAIGGGCGGGSVRDLNLRMLQPLERIKPLQYSRQLSLGVNETERAAFRQYMQAQGIDFSRPVVLVGATAKLQHKVWAHDRMTEVLRRTLDTFPQAQLVLNYAPGREADDARAMAEALQSARVFLNIEAKGIRQLMAMVDCCTCYFGNEGGTRHIADALGKPTFSICSPAANRQKWIPAGQANHQAVCPADFATKAQLEAMTYAERYALLTPDAVWAKLCPFLTTYASREA